MIIWQSKVDIIQYRVVLLKDGGFYPSYCYYNDGEWTTVDSKPLDLKGILHWIGQDLGKDILIV